MKKIRSIIQKQINKHRKEIKYQVNNFVKLSFKNIKIIKSLRKLSDRISDSFKSVEKINVFYRLKLSLNMHQHDVFLFNYSKFAINNSLLN